MNAYRYIYMLQAEEFNFSNLITSKTFANMINQPSGNGARI